MDTKLSRPLAAPFLAARRVLLTGVALLLATVVVAVPASAADSETIGFSGQPVAVAIGPDGTL